MAKPPPFATVNHICPALGIPRVSRLQGDLVLIAALRQHGFWRRGSETRDCRMLGRIPAACENGATVLLRDVLRCGVPWTEAGIRDDQDEDCYRARQFHSGWQQNNPINDRFDCHSATSLATS